MPFDPAFPSFQSHAGSAAMRAQFNALKELIDAVPAGPQGETGPPGPPFSTAVVDAVFVTTDGTANVVANFDGAIVHLTFWIPQGPQGPQGPPGEVSLTELDTAIAGTARNPDTVAPLDTPYADAEKEEMRQKINELIAGTKRP